MGPAEPPDTVAARLVQALAEPVQLAGSVVTVGVSVGLASACPGTDDGIEGAELLRRADLAMYAAERRQGHLGRLRPPGARGPRRRAVLSRRPVADLPTQQVAGRRPALQVAGGAACQNRTDDNLITSEVLYRLS